MPRAAPEAVNRRGREHGKLERWRLVAEGAGEPAASGLFQAEELNAVGREIYPCAASIRPFTLARMNEQLGFEWSEVAEKTSRRREEWEPTKTFLPGVDGPVIRPKAGSTLRRLLRDRVEEYLKDRGIPHVDVNEAKKALFASTKLTAFHFVAYNKTGPNWLIWAAHFTAKAKEDMREWEKVFGEGFQAVVAKKTTGSDVSFQSLNGEQMEIS